MQTKKIVSVLLVLVLLAGLLSGCGPKEAVTENGSESESVNDTSESVEDNPSETSEVPVTLEKNDTTAKNDSGTGSGQTKKGGTQQPVQGKVPDPVKDTSKPQTTKSNIRSILFLGNSFTYMGNVPRQVSEIASLYGIDVKYESVAVGSATLSTIMDRALQKIKDGNFDAVVMQDYGGRPTNDFLADVKRISDAARAKGATPILYNPAYTNIDGKPNKNWQAINTGEYLAAAKASNILLANVGDAWVYAYMKHPNLELYIKNDYHANKEGAYFTACVIVTTIFGFQVRDKNPNGLYRDGNELILGQAAWEFVTYYKQNGRIPSTVITVPDA